MSDFNPGDGWRELGPDEQYGGAKEWLTMYTTSDERLRRWVRQESVPPLPTEAWTTFRTTHTGGGTGTWLRHANGSLLAVHSGEFWQDDPKDITGFEVLAVPPMSLGQATVPVDRIEKRVRRETAKAVIDRVRSQTDEFALIDDYKIDEIAHEFGVDS